MILTFSIQCYKNYTEFKVQHGLVHWAFCRSSVNIIILKNWKKSLVMTVYNFRILLYNELLLVGYRRRSLGHWAAVIGTFLELVNLDLCKTTLHIQATYTSSISHWVMVLLIVHWDEWNLLSLGTEKISVVAKAFIHGIWCYLVIIWSNPGIVYRHLNIGK